MGGAWGLMGWGIGLDFFHSGRWGVDMSVGHGGRVLDGAWGLRSWGRGMLDPFPSPLYSQVLRISYHFIRTRPVAIVMFTSYTVRYN